VIEHSTREKLLSLCRYVVENQLQTAEEMMRLTQESANEETKSSAGDKYETGRAMAQLEIEKGRSQWAEARKLKAALEQLREPANQEVASRGSLVFTDQGNYFLSIPAGKLEVDGVTWFAISPASPLGSVLIGARPGAVIPFQNNQIRVEALG
jgi:hypothetical protein